MERFLRNTKEEETQAQTLEEEKHVKTIDRHWTEL